jgi:hypothetical protein
MHWPLVLLVPLIASQAQPSSFNVTDDADRIHIAGTALEASIRKKGYVSGVEAQSLLDKKTGFHDLGFGLDMVDWIMEPGSDEGYRAQLPGDLPYLFNNLYHGRRAKRSIEGAANLHPRRPTLASHHSGQGLCRHRAELSLSPGRTGKKTGSRWEQTIVFPTGKRYFLSCDRITTVNDSGALFLRIDMPGHIKHKNGDSFSEVYLSYHGRIPASEFVHDFPPDEKYLYVRDKGKVPKRFIRAYHIRDPKTGKGGPLLAGMTLDPEVVCEAWCHERGYICLIEEFGGRPIKAGQSFSAAFVVGFFDSIDEMEQVYDQYAGANSLRVDTRGWKLGKLP